MRVREACHDDLPVLLDLHNYAVKHLDAIWTEHEEVLEERRRWFDGRVEAGFPVLMAVDDDGAVLGYASYGPYRPKQGYRLTVEHSVYIFPDAQGKGAGKALMAALIAHAREHGFHAMVAGIEARNEGSIRLHERFGFTVAGRMDQIGQKHGKWLDLVLMLLRLDDRPEPPRT